MRIKTSSALIALMIAFVAFCVPPTVAHANAGGVAEGTKQVEVAEQATVPVTAEQEPVPEAETVPLTPEGQMTLVDDIAGDGTDGKQFLTIITKGGNYFYIVIDRTGDTENVHFLNLVDESDLLALIEDGTTTAMPAATPAPVEPEPPAAEPVSPEPEPASKPQVPLDIPVILGAVVLLALAGAGALLYIKVLRPKRGTKAGNPNDIDFENFDFDDDGPEELPFAVDDDGTDVDEPTEDTGYVAADGRQEARADR